MSLFFLLTTPLLQFAPVRMDHYNFYLLGSFAGSHTPYMLALLLNLVLACGRVWRSKSCGDGRIPAPEAAGAPTSARPGRFSRPLAWSTW